MRYRILHCLAILGILGSIAFAAQAQTKEGVGIAAIVGDDAISTEDVQERLKLAISSSGLQDQPGIKQKLLPQIVQLLVDEKLYAQEANRLNITVNDVEMAQAISGLETKNNVAPGKFPEFLAKQGISFTALRQQLTAQYLWHKIIGKAVQPQVNVTDQELDEKLEYFSRNNGIAELNLSQIVLPIDKPEDEKKVSALAKRLVAELRKGAKFDAVAREFSRSPSADNGGDIGWQRQDQLDEAVRPGIENLIAGGISEPIKTPDNYYIIRLNERRVLVPVQEGETEVGLKQAVVPLAANISKAQQKAEIGKLTKESLAVTSCDNFDDFAKKVGSSASPKMVMVQIKSLNQEIRNAIFKLPVGQVSPVMPGNSALHVFMVCERTDATPALADKDKIRDVVFREKLELKARRYLRDLRRNAFIDIRL